jgi:hypothetical protein
MSATPSIASIRPAGRIDEKGQMRSLAPVGGGGQSPRSTSMVRRARLCRRVLAFQQTFPAVGRKFSAIRAAVPACRAQGIRRNSLRQQYKMPYASSDHAALRETSLQNSLPAGNPPAVAVRDGFTPAMGGAVDLDDLKHTLSVAGPATTRAIAVQDDCPPQNRTEEDCKTQGEQ